MNVNNASMQYDSTNLLVHPDGSDDPDVIVEVTPELAGWDYIHFQARRLGEGTSWSLETGDFEVAVVLLGGSVRVDLPDGGRETLRGRSHVFEGPPHALYVPRRSRITLGAESDSEFAVARVRTDEDHPFRLITPDDIDVEIRGGDNATRQINSIIPPGFDCHRLVVVEVYTPGGGWSSYPPHKHDVHRTDAEGALIEADLEEIYYYKVDRPDGYAYQRVYTDEHSPLQREGRGFDELLMPRNNDVVLVPEGYHPVVSPPGYTTYYLNILAGSAQSLAAVDDPAHGWVKDTYATRNPAVPIY